VNPAEIRKLLGGYAAGILTGEERRALLEAALEDQSLFDDLSREGPLIDLLEDPASRRELLVALDPHTSFISSLRAWMRRPVAWAAAGSMASAVVMVAVLAWRAEQSETGAVLVARVGRPQDPEVAEAPKQPGAAREEPLDKSHPGLVASQERSLDALAPHGGVGERQTALSPEAAKPKAKKVELKGRPGAAADGNEYAGGAYRRDPGEAAPGRSEGAVPAVAQSSASAESVEVLRSAAGGLVSAAVPARGRGGGNDPLTDGVEGLFVDAPTSGTNATSEPLPVTAAVDRAGNGRGAEVAGFALSPQAASEGTKAPVPYRTLRRNKDGTFTEAAADAVFEGDEQVRLVFTPGSSGRLRIATLDQPTELLNLDVVQDVAINVDVPARESSLYVVFTPRTGSPAQTGSSAVFHISIPRQPAN
jgi:hypothetical protein